MDGRSSRTGAFPVGQPVQPPTIPAPPVMFPRLTGSRFLMTKLPQLRAVRASDPTWDCSAQTGFDLARISAGVRASMFSL